VNYNFGVLSVTVTASGKKITNIGIASLDDGGNGRSQAIDQQSIPMLEQQAMQAQSANIQGVSEPATRVPALPSHSSQRSANWGSRGPSSERPHGETGRTTGRPSAHRGDGDGGDGRPLLLRRRRSSEAAVPLAKARAILQRADSLFSTWKNNSPMSRLRRGEISVADAPPEMVEVLERCAEAREISGDGSIPGRCLAG